MGVPKSWKTIEIMQQCKYGFNLDYVNKLCSEWSVIKDYAYIMHDKDTKSDGILKEPHIHLMIRFNSAVPTTAILNKLQGVCEVQHLEKIKGGWNNAIAYLTHANDKTKHQYEENEVLSNFEWQADRDKALASKGRLESIINGIDEGIIREYNYGQHISISEYTKYKRQIESAFKYRTDKLKGVDRDMKAIYIFGDSGTGKSTMAKDIAREHGYSVYVSSGSNDVLDDYQGQDCLILDDMRPSCLGLSDLLKLLDPNTASSVKSRFKNKVLECKLIIITTTLPIDRFFHNVFESEHETAVQLKRRCQTLIELTATEMRPYLWQSKSRVYKPYPAQPNPVLAKFKLDDMSTEEGLELLENMLGSMYKTSVNITKDFKDGEFTPVEMLPDENGDFPF